MGVIPLSLHSVIETFAAEIGKTAGAYIATFKDTMIRTLPLHLFDAKLGATIVNGVHPHPISAPGDKIRADTLKDLTTQATKAIQAPTKALASESFPYMGITCSTIFASMSNLRPSQMPKENASCRRCININRVFLATQSIEKFFFENPNQFRTFFNSLTILRLLMWIPL